MLKVLKMEGTYPSGIIEGFWPLSTWAKRRGYRVAEFYGRGEGWKRYRSFLQKDLLAPQAAREYLPAILEGAQRASAKAPTDGSDFNRYLNRCALDMFGMVLFGNYRNDTTADEYELFCQSAVYSLSETMKLKRTPHFIVAMNLGIPTERINRLYKNLDIILDIGSRRITNFRKRYEEGSLDEKERVSYLARAIERQRESDLSEDEAVYVCTLLLLAAVDTTAANIGWTILQLGIHREIQDQLYRELDTAVQKEGELNASVFEKSKTPLLQAVIRETHRVTPTILFNIVKEVSHSSVSIHGVELPSGSVVIFDSFNPQLNPDLVDDPSEFRPERWFPDAVEARKGTQKEVIDHPLFSAPFSQGARRCPGSRVANLETQAMVAQMILDWKFILPEGLKVDDVEYAFETTLIPSWPELRLEQR